MTVNLRDYQATMIDAARTGLRTHRRILLQAPTGAGKTVLAAFMTSETAAKAKRVVFICHRKELLQGTSNTFSKLGIVHSFIAAGMPYDARASVHIALVDTLKNRLHIVTEPHLTIWDECHHLGAEGWLSIMSTWTKSRHVGLSATPWRLDGSGLDDAFDDMVPGPEVSWLIDNGYLAPFRIFAPTKPDMKGVRKERGDYAKGETSKRMQVPKRVGDYIMHWRKLADGVRTIGFAINVQDSKLMAETFNSAGIPAAHLDGTTDKAERKRIIDGYADGVILIVMQVGLFGEGFDLAAYAQRDVTVGAVLDAAPTQSLSNYRQRGGRMMRFEPGKIGIYMDHAGNSDKHGFFDDPVEWSLQGWKEAGKGGGGGLILPPVTCDGCFNQIRRPLPEFCPFCSKRLMREAKAIEFGEGNLEEKTDSDKVAQRAARAKELHDARSLADLVALGRKRGYKDPQAWAWKTYSNSSWRKAVASKARDDSQNQLAENNYHTDNAISI